MKKDKELLYYITEKGNSPFIEWLESLDNVTQARIDSRIHRLKLGNYGEFKRLQKSILELKLDFGPGYRVYFAEITKNVLLLLGGDKSTQNKDIKKAEKYYKDFMERQNGK
ncbi:MAG: type II toxin-antitoxin system RelE/ParE family toxin [Sphingobacteriia bacterium]|nr:type II toxin-antitoxin system RelE/ParE family toxin [Sphingobacteriia bacterium]